MRRGGAGRCCRSHSTGHTVLKLAPRVPEPKALSLGDSGNIPPNSCPAGLVRWQIWQTCSCKHECSQEPGSKALGAMPGRGQTQLFLTSMDEASITLQSCTCASTHRTSEPASASFCLRKALRWAAASSAAELGIWDALFTC